MTCMCYSAQVSGLPHAHHIGQGVVCTPTADQMI